MTVAYAIGAGLLEAHLAELRLAVDAVISSDGQIEESVPRSHGLDAFALSTLRVDPSPEATLKALYLGGVRSVLLLGDYTIASRCVAAGLVDRVLVHLDSAGDASSPTPPGAEGLLPPGFRLTHVTKSDRHIRIEATAAGAW